MSAENIGTNIISRLIDRITKLPVRLASDDAPEPSIMGTIGSLYERQAAWSAAHGRTFDQERWENPARAARYLASGECEAHPDGPQKH